MRLRRSAATASSATPARATRTSSWSVASQGYSRCSRSSPVRRRSPGPEDRGPALPLLRPLAGRVAGHRHRGPARQRRARRPAAGTTASPDRARPGPGPRARHHHPQRIRLSDHRSAAGRRRHRRRRRRMLFRRGGIYVTRWSTRWSRETRSVSASATAANTDEQVDHLCEVLGEVAECFKLQRPSAASPTTR